MSPAMHEIFISVHEKGMDEKEYILQFLLSVKILDKYGTSKDVVE